MATERLFRPHITLLHKRTGLLSRIPWYTQRPAMTAIHDQERIDTSDEEWRSSIRRICGTPAKNPSRMRSDWIDVWIFFFMVEGFGQGDRDAPPGWTSRIDRQFEPSTRGPIWHGIVSRGAALAA